MSHRQFEIVDRVAVPPALVAAHSTLPQPSIYVLHNNASEELKLIRLLLGNVKVNYLPGGSWSQTKNYSQIGAPGVGFKKYAHIDTLLLAHNILVPDLNKHLKATLAQRAYYGELLAEILQYFRRSRAGEHTLAFLHLYRFLEHISFAFPLLYAARSTNFKEAFVALRDFFGTAAGGELRFFEKFVDSAIDPATRNQTVKLLFHTVDPGYLSRTFAAVKRQIEAAAIVSDIVDSEIELNCYALSAMCINLRNRFFHFRATDSTNISLNDVGDPNDLFECVNHHIFNWFAVLFFETLHHRVYAPI